MIDFFKMAAENNLQFFIENYEALENIEYKDEKGRTLLACSAYNHSYEVVYFLIEKGADINEVNNKGTTVFMYAKTKVFENRNFGFLEYLVSKGADFKKKDIFGKTVFDYVVEKGDIEMIDFFIKNKYV